MGSQRGESPGYTQLLILADSNAGIQIASHLRIHDWDRADREATTMVQHEGRRNSQLHRVCLLDRPHRHQYNGCQGVQRIGLYLEWLDHCFGFLASVSQRQDSS